MFHLLKSIREINNTPINNAKNINAVMPVHILIKYSHNYSKTSGSLWQYYRDKPVLNNGAIVDFAASNTSNSFNFRGKITG